MFSWAVKRKLMVIVGISIVALIFFFIFIKPQFEIAPTCFDGMQNGKESGVDCGGSCAQFCDINALPIVTTWSRSFEVIPGRYNAIALVENQNTDAAVVSISYEFKLYDDNNVFIARRTGKTYILPNNQTAIFAPGISTGDRIPVRTDFAFTEEPFWLQTPKGLGQGLTPTVSNILMKDPFTKPTLTATIKNNSRFDLTNFDVVAVLYNSDNNAIAASTTFIESLPEGGKYEVFFTWQKSFVEEPVRIEILPQVNVFDLNDYRSS